jgi:hypothetical protein
MLDKEKAENSTSLSALDCNILTDKALQAQAWLLNLKSPAARASKNLRGFLEAHKFDMSQMDSSFIMDDRYRNDLVTLSWEEKEAMSRFLEKYLYKAFEDKVCHRNALKGVRKCILTFFF